MMCTQFKVFAGISYHMESENQYQRSSMTQATRMNIFFALIQSFRVNNTSASTFTTDKLIAPHSVAHPD